MFFVTGVSPLKKGPMNLLIVTAQYPFPLRTGGAIVAYNQVLDLASRHSVHFICCDLEKQPSENEDFPAVEFVPRKPRSLFIRCWEALWGFPLVVSSLRSVEMQKRVREILSGAKRFDAVLLYGLQSLQYCPRPFLRR